MARSIAAIHVILLTALYTSQKVKLAASFDFLSDSAETIVNPETQIVKPGGQAVFQCVGIGENADVLINDDRYRSDLHENQTIYKEVVYESNNKKKLTITVEDSTAELNNTKIKCRFDEGGPVNYSTEAELIVAGPPLAPSFEVTILNRTSLQVSWNEPFTWPGFEIQSYSLLIRYTSSGNESKIQDIDATRRSYILMRDSAAEECKDIEFFLTATSDVGESSPHVAFGGIPKDETKVLVTTDVSFQKDGSPQVDIWVKLKSWSTYLTYNYTLSVKADSETIITLDDNQVEHLRIDLVHSKLRSLLTLGEEYEAFARVDSLVDNSSNFSLFTTESEWFTVPTEEAKATESTATQEEEETTATEKEEPSKIPDKEEKATESTATQEEEEAKATEKEEPSKIPDKEEKVEACNCELEGTQTTSNISSQTCDLNMWIVAVGGAAIFIAVMLLVASCLVLYFMASKRKQQCLDAEKIPPTNTKPMQNNPIYEGAIYETLDGLTPLDELKTELTPNGSIKNSPLPQLPKEGNTDVENVENLKDVNQVPDTYLAMENFIPLKEEEIDANLNIPPSDTTSVRSKQLSPSNTYVTMHSAVANERQDN